MNAGSIRSKISERLEKLKRLKKRFKKKRIKPGVEKKIISEALKEISFEEVKRPRFAILGIGNDLKGDDGVGWYVADKLRKEFKDDENLLIVKTSVPENHVNEINDFAPTMLVIIDSADFKKSPGEIKTIKGYQVSESFISTHTTPLTVFIRLYQADQAVKKPFILIGIQRKSNEFGQPISTPVKKAGDTLTKLISRLYRRNVLDLSLEKELAELSKPLKRLVRNLKGK